MASVDAREGTADGSVRDLAAAIARGRDLHAEAMNALFRAAARAVLRWARTLVLEPARSAWQLQRDGQLLDGMNGRMLADIGLERGPYGIWPVSRVEAAPARREPGVVVTMPRWRGGAASARELDAAA